MNHVLCQVPGQLKFSDAIIGKAIVMAKVRLLQLVLSFQDPLNLLSKELIFSLFIVKELGAF